MPAPPAAHARDPDDRSFLGDRAGVSAQAQAVAPSGFQDSVALGGLTEPVAVRFSPDGRVFVAEKAGVIKVFDDLADATPAVYADLRTNVNSFWDRGLLGFTLHPNYPETPHVYVLYAYDAAIGASAPRWNDGCPTPPGATTDGCVVSGRLSRLTGAGAAATGPEAVFINDWCQQYPGHSVGDLRFGPDGALYVSAGEGASFTFTDYGQGGGSLANTPTPKNPCGDPPVPVGGTQAPPGADGGSLRSQSVRRPAGRPVVLNGSIARVNPATGAPLPDNPLAAHPDARAQRIVAYGLRNPFRFTFRPGTSELWVGDVGPARDEIDRIVNPLASGVANAGWPCYEAPNRQANWDAANLDRCESLYAAPANLLAPYFAYGASAPVMAGDTCPTGGQALAGLAFYGTGTYPAAYRNALFFADHSRNCIWAMRAGTSGLPDPSRLETFVAGASNPVALEIGPGGDLFYVNFEGGAIHRITFDAVNNPPAASFDASPTDGPAPLAVTFDGRGSRDPDPGDTLTHAWDLDGDGAFDDGSLATAEFTYEADGAYEARLRVTDSRGASDTASQAITVGQSALPRPTIDTPTSSVTWHVGEAVSFSGRGEDGAGEALPASALTWTLVMHHCPATCHTHAIQTWAGVESGSFDAPDHDYPSHLELRLTADWQGQRSSTGVELQPETVRLDFRSDPTGFSISVGPTIRTTPFSATSIVGSTLSVAAPSPQKSDSGTYEFASWSDGGAAAHDIVAPSGPTTYTATFEAITSTTGYLSDQAYVVVTNGWGPVEKDRSNGESAAGDGRSLTIGGVTYAKGLGAHAVSDIRLALNGACSRFQAVVGVDDEVAASQGTVVFEVWGDSVRLAQTGTITGAMAGQALDVNLTGRTTLRLVITGAGDGIGSDHADWADARLTCDGTAPRDTVAPTATGPVHAFVPGGTLTSGAIPLNLSWSGSDATSGVARYELRQQTNGGAWTTVSNSLTGTSLRRNLAPGYTYRFAVRAVDKAGNVGAFAYGAPFTLAGYQQNASAARYTGPWKTGTSSYYWGGTAAYSATAGATASFGFTGRSFALVASRGPTRGKARIYVNGSHATTIDLYAASTQHRRVVWAGTWSTSATRTISVRVSGTGGRPTVVLDGFAVVR